MNEIQYCNPEQTNFTWILVARFLDLTYVQNLSKYLFCKKKTWGLKKPNTWPCKHLLTQGRTDSKYFWPLIRSEELVFILSRLHFEWSACTLDSKISIRLCLYCNSCKIPRTVFDNSHISKTYEIGKFPFPFAWWSTKGTSRILIHGFSSMSVAPAIFLRKSLVCSF